MNDKIYPNSDTLLDSDGAPFPCDPPPLDHSFEVNGTASHDCMRGIRWDEMYAGQREGQSEPLSWPFRNYEPDPRALVRWLKKLRKRRGFDKHEFARRLCCDVRALSKVEKGFDGDLSVADVAEYVEGLGMSCVLQIIEDDMTGELELQRTLIETERWLTRLHRLFERSGNREAMRQVESFICRTTTPPLIESYSQGNNKNADCNTGVLRVELSPSI